MIDRGLNKRHIWIIAAAIEQAFECDEPYFQSKWRIFACKVASSTHERRRFDTRGTCAFERQIEEPSVLGRGKPLAAITACFDEVQKDLSPADSRISLGKLSKDRKVSRATCGLQPIAGEPKRPIAAMG